MSNDQPVPSPVEPVVPAAAAAPDAPAAPLAPASIALDPGADPSSWTPVEAPGPRCPWCSAALPAGDLQNCPGCRAQLAGNGNAALPGLTEVQPAQKGAPLETVRRNRLLAWISGEVLDDQITPANTPAAAEAIAPPSADVRREILRLQLRAAGIEVPVAPGPEAASGAPAIDAAHAEPPTDTDRESTAA